MEESNKELQLHVLLAHNPKIIIADEPTGNLDDFNADVVWNLLKGANEQLGITVVVVTHRVPKI